MAETSHIEWTDATWQVTHGCTKVSPGCENCYAEKLAGGRLRRFPQYAAVTNQSGRWNNRVTVDEDALATPLKWRAPKMVFVNSMSDLFHDDVPDAFIDRVFAVMAMTPQHTFQVLTKRPERMRSFFTDLSRTWPGAVDEIEIRTCTIAAAQILREKFADHAGPGARAEIPWPLPNVWLGVPAEDQERADERIPHLLATPAAVRFLNLEPMLGPINLRPYLADHEWAHGVPGGIGWVVFGCESGPNRRPCDLDWIRGDVGQCHQAGGPAFVKQIEVDGRVSKDPDEWPEDLRVREWPDDG